MHVAALGEIVAVVQRRAVRGHAGAGLLHVVPYGLERDSRAQYLAVFEVFEPEQRRAAALMRKLHHAIEPPWS
jgi:hypothetical protein